jgi:hypothetical protein
MLVVLIIALVIISIICQRVLIVVCCIDERVDELEECLCTISDVTSRDVLGVFRKSDVKCKAVTSRYIEVPDYDTSTTTRHNLTGIASKRTAALDYARANGYDQLIFIDSDIRIDRCTIPYLLIGTLFADISCVPYAIRWADMTPVLGYDNPPRIDRAKTGIMPFYRCTAAGMGCTCISLKSSRIPERFVNGTILGIAGEDIGFFLDAKDRNARVVATSWHVARHV